jgi:hypothetical protein
VIRQVSSQLADFLRLGPTPASSDEVGCSAVNRRVVRSSRFRINSSKILGDDLSRLVHQRAARKPISDARTATYVILSTGSGPGGRWFKSIRPDHLFPLFQEGSCLVVRTSGFAVSALCPILCPPNLSTAMNTASSEG